MNPSMTPAGSDPDTLRSAAKLEALLGRLASETELAGQALQRGDLEQIGTHLDERDRILAESADHFEVLRLASSRAASADDRRRLDSLVEEIVHSARSVTEGDSRLELALGAGRQQLRSEIDRVEETRTKSSNYRVERGPAGGTIDLKR